MTAPEPALAFGARCGVEDRAIDRPTKFERTEALAFFERLLARMDQLRVRDMTVSSIRDMLGIHGKGLCPALEAFLAVVGMTTVPSGRPASGDMGVTRDQVKRALGKLRPAAKGARAGR